MQEKPWGISVDFVDENLVMWNVKITAPIGSIYEGGEYDGVLHLHDFPFNPPTFVFTMPPFHPNIGSDGTVCLDQIFHHWMPCHSILSFLLSVQFILLDVNVDFPSTDALNIDAYICFTEFPLALRSIVEQQQAHLKTLAAESGSNESSFKEQDEILKELTERFQSLKTAFAPPPVFESEDDASIGDQNETLDDDIESEVSENEKESNNESWAHLNANIDNLLSESDNAVDGSDDTAEKLDTELVEERNSQLSECLQASHETIPSNDDEDRVTEESASSDVTFEKLRFKSDDEGEQCSADEWELMEKSQSDTIELQNKNTETNGILAEAFGKISSFFWGSGNEGNDRGMP